LPITNPGTSGRVAAGRVEMAGDRIQCALACAALLAGLLVSGCRCSDEANEVMVYSLTCTEPCDAGWTCPADEWSSNSKYRVKLDENAVEHVFPGGGRITLVDCGIYDLKNWQCSYKDGSGIVIMTDGRVTESTTVVMMADSRQISRLEYELFQLKTAIQTEGWFWGILGWLFFH
jgi:hypothetical protein